MADQIVAEEWRECPGFPNYSVSNLGRIRRDVAQCGTRAGRMLSGSPNKDGYMEAHPCRGGKSPTRKVHRLVALAFLGQPPEGKPQVNHKNGVKTDNRVENLEWASSQDDADHRVRMGLVQRGDSHYARISPERMPRGERNGYSKLTEALVREIRRRCAAGESQWSVARSIGVGQTCIWKVCNRETWVHVK